MKKIQTMNGLLKNIQTVSKYMGHSDSTVTLKVYAHFIPDTASRAMDAFAKLA